MPDGTSSILSKICVNWRDVAIFIKTVFSDLKSVSKPLALHWEIIVIFQKLNLVTPLRSHYFSSGSLAILSNFFCFIVFTIVFMRKSGLSVL